MNRLCTRHHPAFFECSPNRINSLQLLSQHAVPILIYTKVNAQDPILCIAPSITKKH